MKREVKRTIDTVQSHHNRGAFSDSEEGVGSSPPAASEASVERCSPPVNMLACHISGLVKTFVEKWYKKSKNADTNLMPRIVTFGSMYLTPTEGRDLDLLAMYPAPKNDGDGKKDLCDFELFVKDCPDVKCVSRFEMSAYTPPLIRFKLHNFHVDLLFARVPKIALSESISLDCDWEKAFSGADRPDPASLMALRAVAVIRRIAKLVPDLSKFRVLLSIVKKWAIRRRIYKQAFGYPGGIAYAVMCAKLCIEDDCFGDRPILWLLDRFYDYYNRVNWGREGPIFIGEYRPQLRGGQRFSDTWDRWWSKFMIVLTPERDPINCTHNVNNSSLPAIKEEFARAENILKKGTERARQLDDDQAALQGVLFELLEPDTFFVNYPHYIRFDVVTWKEDEYYEGFTASALRRFTSQVCLSDRVSEARLYPVATPTPLGTWRIERNREIVTYWVGIQYTGNESSLSSEFEKLETMLHKTRDRNQNMCHSFVKREHLPDWAFPKVPKSHERIRPKGWNPPPMRPPMDFPKRRISPPRQGRKSRDSSRDTTPNPQQNRDRGKRARQGNKKHRRRGRAYDKNRYNQHDSARKPAPRVLNRFPTKDEKKRPSVMAQLNKSNHRNEYRNFGQTHASSAGRPLPEARSQGPPRGKNSVSFPSMSQHSATLHHLPVAKTKSVAVDRAHMRTPTKIVRNLDSTVRAFGNPIKSTAQKGVPSAGSTVFDKSVLQNFLHQRC